VSLSTRAAVESASAAVVHGAAAAGAGGLGAAAHAALPAAAAGLVWWSALVCARAMQRAFATIGEITALVWIRRAGQERWAAAFSRHIVGGRAAYVARAGAAAVDRTAAAVVELAPALAGIEAAAGARLATGVVRFTYRSGRARAIDGAAIIAEGRAASAVARRQCAAAVVLRIARLPGRALVADAAAAIVGQGRVAGAVATRQRTTTADRPGALRAAHATGCAGTVQGFPAAVRQGGATLVFVIDRAGLGRATSAVLLADLLGAVRAGGAVLADLPLAPIVERSATHVARFGR